MNTFYSLTVDADRLAGMRDRTGKRIRSFSLVVKAFAAGIITVAGMLSCHHDISFTAQAILIIGTTFYDTFQICHIFLTFCRSRRPSFFVTKQFVTGQKLYLQKDTRQMRRRSPTTRHPYFVRCAEKYTYYWIFVYQYDIFLLLVITNHFILYLLLHKTIFIHLKICLYARLIHLHMLRSGLLFIFITFPGKGQILSSPEGKFYCIKSDFPSENKEDLQ